MIPHARAQERNLRRSRLTVTTVGGIMSGRHPKPPVHLPPWNPGKTPEKTPTPCGGENDACLRILATVARSAFRRRCLPDPGPAPGTRLLGRREGLLRGRPAGLVVPLVAAAGVVAYRQQPYRVPMKRTRSSGSVPGRNSSSADANPCNISSMGNISPTVPASAESEP